MLYQLSYTPSSEHFARNPCGDARAANRARSEFALVAMVCHALPNRFGSDREGASSPISGAAASILKTPRTRMAGARRFPCRETGLLGWRSMLTEWSANPS